MAIDAKEREGSDITFGGKHSGYTVQTVNMIKQVCFLAKFGNTFLNILRFVEPNLIFIRLFSEICQTFGHRENRSLENIRFSTFHQILDQSVRENSTLKSKILELGS